MVAPAIGAPPFVHAYVNGPVPEATVVNVADAPGHNVKLVSGVAVVFVKTTRSAQLVTLVQKPLTFTQYCAASAATTDGIVKLALVAPAIGAPPFVHAYVNGPVPEATVVNVALDPGHNVKLVNGVAVVFVRTVRFAQLVTVPQRPKTFTQYCAASDATTEGIVKLALVAPAIGAPPFVHAYVNGPVPEATVVNVALDPGHKVKLVNGVASVGGRMLNVEVQVLWQPFASVSVFV